MSSSAAFSSDPSSLVSGANLLSSSTETLVPACNSPQVVSGSSSAPCGSTSPPEVNNNLSSSSVADAEHSANPRGGSPHVTWGGDDNNNKNLNTSSVHSECNGANPQPIVSDPEDYNVTILSPPNVSQATRSTKPKPRPSEHAAVSPIGIQFPNFPNSSSFSPTKDQLRQLIRVRETELDHHLRILREKDLELKGNHHELMAHQDRLQEQSDLVVNLQKDLGRAQEQLTVLEKESADSVHQILQLEDELYDQITSASDDREAAIQEKKELEEKLNKTTAYFQSKERISGRDLLLREQALQKELDSLADEKRIFQETLEDFDTRVNLETRVSQERKFEENARKLGLDQQEQRLERHLEDAEKLRQHQLNNTATIEKQQARNDQSAKELDGKIHLFHTRHSEEVSLLREANEQQATEIRNLQINQRIAATFQKESEERQAGKLQELLDLRQTECSDAKMLADQMQKGQDRLARTMFRAFQGRRAIHQPDGAGGYDTIGTETDPDYVESDVGTSTRKPTKIGKSPQVGGKERRKATSPLVPLPPVHENDSDFHCHRGRRKVPSPSAQRPSVQEDDSDIQSEVESESVRVWRTEQIRLRENDKLKREAEARQAASDQELAKKIYEDQLLKLQNDYLEAASATKNQKAEALLRHQYPDTGKVIPNTESLTYPAMIEIPSCSGPHRPVEDPTQESRLDFLEKTLDSTRRLVEVNELSHLAELDKLQQLSETRTKTLEEQFNSKTQALQEGFSRDTAALNRNFNLEN
ncbi:MAG: hypothetical protein GY818_14775, partial [Planctomycetaceae bacterium]|nr:hypothetical protein [Planctomycetaceae bacterium]